jgi:hypothetical protein
MERKKPIQSVSTRWNSTFYMLQYFLDYRKPISEFFRRYAKKLNLEIFSDQEWRIIDSLVSIFQPLEEVLKYIYIPFSYSCILVH